MFYGLTRQELIKLSENENFCILPWLGIDAYIRGFCVCCKARNKVNQDLVKPLTEKGLAEVESLKEGMRKSYLLNKIPQECEWCFKAENNIYGKAKLNLFKQLSFEEGVFVLGLGLHNICNLKCLMASGDCSTQFGSRAEVIDLENLNHLLQKNSVIHCNILGGEIFYPNKTFIEDIQFFHPEINLNILSNFAVPDMVEKFEKVLKLYPNTKLGVSIDGVPSTHARIRKNIDMDVFFSNIEKLKPFITYVIHCYSKYNEFELDDSIEYIQQLLPQAKIRIQLDFGSNLKIPDKYTQQKRE